jgi:hypothetical protein
MNLISRATFVTLAATLAVGLFIAVPASTSTQKRAPGHATLRSRVAPSGSDWLGEINLYREAAGLNPVTAQVTWGGALADHLTYIEKTPDIYLTGTYVSENTENPSSPYFTAAGAQEGATSDVVVGVGGESDVAVIDGWLSEPFHAVGLLRANLGQVGFADQDGDAALDVTSGLSGNGAVTSPVLFPGSGTTTDLTTYADEAPSALQTCKWSGTSAVGLPLIALLSSPPTTGLTATLTSTSGVNESSTNGSLCIVDASNFVSTDSLNGPTGLSTLQNNNAVFLIPKVPLAEGSFTATIDQTGQGDISWTFNVVTLPNVTTRTLAAARVGRAYHRSLAVNGGQAPFTWSITSGALPGGVRLTPQGVLVGAPNLVGSYYVQIVATDALGYESPVQDLVLRVNPR